MSTETSPVRPNMLGPPSRPLAVDLDGTLLATDTLYETIALNLFRRPLATVAACAAVVRGKAALKRSVAALELPEPETLPLNADFVEYLKGERAAGRDIHLVTAADQRIAEHVAARIGLFDSVTGTSSEENLKGPAKAELLAARFPEGFAYAGDHAADLAVWRKADGAVLVGTSARTRRAAEDEGVAVEAEFPRARAGTFRLWRKALRLHQWSKNVLILAPLFLAHLYTDVSAVLAALAAFLLMGLVASGTYLVNDLSDLAADRAHRTKRHRPFAAGTLPVRDGLAAAPLLIGTGLLGGLVLSPAFGALLLVYLVTTLAYSFGLKRVPMADVFILGSLYCLRLVMGVAVIGVALSPWLAAFGFCFFFAMSLAKRHVDLVKAKDLPPDVAIPGRGYRPADWPVTLAMGAAATFASIIVVVLYIVEEAFATVGYGAPEFLWAAPALILLWTQRIWLLAHRGELDDDPVSFAIRDRVSLLLGAVLGVFFVAAVAA